MKTRWSNYLTVTVRLSDSDRHQALAAELRRSPRMAGRLVDLGLLGFAAESAGFAVTVVNGEVRLVPPARATLAKQTDAAAESRPRRVRRTKREVAPSPSPPPATVGTDPKAALSLAPAIVEITDPLAESALGSFFTQFG